MSFIGHFYSRQLWYHAAKYGTIYECVRFGPDQILLHDGSCVKGFKLKWKGLYLLFPDNGGRTDYGDLKNIKGESGSDPWKNYRYWIRIREAIKFQFLILLLFVFSSFLSLCPQRFVLQLSSSFLSSFIRLLFLSSYFVIFFRPLFYLLFIGFFLSYSILYRYQNFTSY